MLLKIRKNKLVVIGLLPSILAIWFLLFTIGCTASNNQPSVVSNTTSETQGKSKNTPTPTTFDNETTVSGQLKIHFIVM